MGLSVLIPVYNFNVTSLINVLVTQLTTAGKTGEIILLDDGSADFVFENQLLQNLPSVSFYRNEKNEGRMLSRQKLAALAKYNYLLFLDCDSEIIKNDFIITYFDAIEKNNSLISGGRIYPANKPGDCSLMLHWKYGTKRENRSSGNIPDKPAFMSNNFLIKKELFIQLDNTLQIAGYGHEDSWWGIQFEKMGIKYLIINNPVLHSALEKAETFLSKSENALQNILLLEKNIDTDSLERHIKIFRWYSRLKRAGIAGLYIFLEKPFHDYFRKNIISCKPNLFYFDCYRLAILIKLAKSESIIQ